MLDKLKILLNISDTTEDALLLLLLELARDKIIEKMYPFEEDTASIELPFKYNSTQLEITLYLYNKQGAEGQTSHSENGISRTYDSSSIPDEMMKNIIPHGKLV